MGLLKSAPTRNLFAVVVLGLAIWLLAGCSAPAAPSPAAPTAAAPAAAPTIAAPAAAPTTAAQAAPATKPTGKPIPLGIVNLRAGTVADAGKRVEVAVRFAIDDVNAAGGVNGSPLEAAFYDTGGDPQQAVVLTRKGIDDKKFVLIGPLLSNEAQAIFPVCVQGQIPCVPGATAMA